MPRRPRVNLVGHPQHAVQRGHNREACFFADAADGNTQGQQNGSERLAFAAGMQATAEILLGSRSVLEYLLSPVQRAWHEAGRER